MRALPAVALLLALLGAAGREADAGEFDRRVEEMLQRAAFAEEPTAEDQRAAARALRDWQLSERGLHPGGDDPRVADLLRFLAAGRRPPDALRPLARDLHRDYLTPEGRDRRLAEGWEQPFRLRTSAGGTAAGGAERSDAGEGWLLLAACAVVLVGGLAVWALAGRRRRRSHRVYYS